MKETMEGLPTPPNEEHIKPNASPKRSNGGNSKPVKAVHRAPKRTGSHTHSTAHSHPQSPGHDSHSQHSADGRHKRVWKACERCRMKKTKCDGEFPCKRCKDDGLVCTAGTRKKTEYKQLPRGYAEVLEHTQFALIATVHKLYAMVRNSQPWDLGEPELNDRGQPVIHNIASRLGCIRPNSDLDLPVHSVFPEDEAGLNELARQLEEQQMDHHKDTMIGGPDAHEPPGLLKHESDSSCNNSTADDHASPADFPDHFSDPEQDFYYPSRSHPPPDPAALDLDATDATDAVTLSPQSSLAPYADFDVCSLPPSNATGFPPPATSAAAAAVPQSPPSFDQSPWMSRPASIDFNTTNNTGGAGAGGRFIPPSGAPSYMGMDLLSQGLLESNFGTIKPHVVSCANPGVMMGMGDPMIYSGYDQEAMRL